MSGSFDVSGATAYILMTAGSAGAVGSGGYSLVVLCQPATGNNNAGFLSGRVSGVNNREIFEDTNALYGDGDFSSGYSGAGITQGNWYIFAQTKASGSNTYRHHIWPYSSSGSGTFSHGVASGSGNHGDGSAINQIQIGANSVKGNGLIAVVGLWTRALSDAELDSMRSPNLSTWKNVSGGQPAELISLENWNGSTGATAVIGTSSLSSITGTVNSGSNPPSFNFSLSGGPTQLNIGQPSETDTALSLSRLKLRTLGQPSETDTAQNTTRRKSRTLGLPAETDTPFTITARKIRTIGIPTDTSTALPITRRKLRTLGIPSETNTAFLTGKRKLKTLGLVTEADSPLGFGHVITSPLGIPSETGTALPMGRLKKKTLGMPSEVDAALGVWGRLKKRSLGLVVESDLALSLQLPNAAPVLPDIVIRTGLSSTTVATGTVSLTVQTG